MEAIKGRGIIRISAKLEESLGNPETNEDWQKALLLPENYAVVSVRPRMVPGLHTNTEIVILVESDAISRNNARLSQTEVMPYYSKVDGKAVLTRIEIRQWNGECWVEVKQDGSATGSQMDSR